MIEERVMRETVEGEGGEWSGRRGGYHGSHVSMNSRAQCGDITCSANGEEGEEILSMGSQYHL